MAKATNNAKGFKLAKGKEQANLPMIGTVKPATSKAGHDYYKVHINLNQVNEAIKANQGTWETSDGKKMISCVGFAHDDNLIIRPQSYDK